MANSRKKQFTLPKVEAPRSMEDLNKLYSEQVARAGQLQYQIVAIQAQLDDANSFIGRLAAEANERQKLDSEQPKQEGV